MNIGILTFHWAANHGAILQTYASCHYLQEMPGVDRVEVIHYLPIKREISLKNALRPHYPKVIYSRLLDFSKELKLKEFRNSLPLTQRYYSNQQLIDSPPDFDIMLAGSDQIWNPSYAMSGEGGPTPVYFLNFGKETCKKAALSASFGCTKYPENVLPIVAPYVRSFDRISVREKTGLDIVLRMGAEGAVLTADPTSLLSREHYLSLCQEYQKPKSEYAALYILRGRQSAVKRQCKKFLRRQSCALVDIENKTMANWLGGINCAKVVITNSFHCILMCLKLHTPFVVILENGTLAGMNDRLYTLLEHFGLTDRIVSDIETADIHASFNWEKADACMETYANSLKEYLQEVISP